MEETTVYTDKDMILEFGLGIITGAAALGAVLLGRKAWKQFRSKRDAKLLAEMAEKDEDEK